MTNKDDLRQKLELILQSQTVHAPLMYTFNMCGYCTECEITPSSHTRFFCTMKGVLHTNICVIHPLVHTCMIHPPIAHVYRHPLMLHNNLGNKSMSL